MKKDIGIKRIDILQKYIKHSDICTFSEYVISKYLTYQTLFTSYIIEVAKKFNTGKSLMYNRNEKNYKY